MKKLFTLIVAICATTLAWADASGSCGENVTWSFVESTGTLTISGTGYMEDYGILDLDDRPWDAYRSSIKKVVINNGVTSIGWNVFYGCEGLTSVTIPNSVTSIGVNTFSYCSRLTSVTIPNSVTSIGGGAFEGCTGLTSIEIPNSVTSIGGQAFYGCTGLTSVTIPNSVTSIGYEAFYGCTGLTSVTIPNSVTSIGEKAFYNCTGLTSMTIGNGVTSVGKEAFNGCNNIETADINSQAAFNAIYFRYNDKLTSIILGDDITSIGSSTFYDCTGLTSVTIPNSVTSIGSAAFYGCTGLTSVTIGNGVTIIGQNAFRNCTALTSITIPNSVTKFGLDVFYGCTGMTSINVAEDNLNYASIDGVWYSKDKKTLIMYPKGKTGSFTIPNGVTSIGDEDDDASCGFEDCTGLTSITIPNSVKYIDFGAFRGCTGLTSMTVEATNPPLAGDQYGNGLEMPNYDIPLYVPAGRVYAYKLPDAYEWKKFTNIQTIATGVNEATVENTAEKSEVKKIIDRNGIIYIEKDGTRYFLNGSKVK